MGADIHIIAQCRDANGEWQDCEITRDLEPRNYTLFAMLCGVRNYYHVPPLVPIAGMRGEPDGFEVDGNDSHNGEWVGNGVCSWLTLAEILAHDLDQVVYPIPGRGDPGPLREGVEGWLDHLLHVFEGKRPEDARIVFGFDS